MRKLGIFPDPLNNAIFADPMNQGVSSTVVAPAHLFEDNFDRADTADGNIGADWAITQPAGIGTTRISSNRVMCDFMLNGHWIRYTGGLVQATDHYAEIDIVGGMSPDGICGLLVRCQAATPNTNFYTARYCLVPPDNHHWQIYRRVNGTYTLLDTLDEVMPALPFRMRFEAQGTTLRLKVKESGGEWVQKCTATDSSFASGQVGFNSDYDATIYFDNFAAGNL